MGILGPCVCTCYVCLIRPAGPQPLVVEEEDGVVSVFCVEAPFFCVCRGEYVRVLFLHNVLRRREERERERAVGPSRLSWVCVSVCVRVVGGGQGDKNGLPKEGTEREEGGTVDPAVRLSACIFGSGPHFLSSIYCVLPPRRGAEAGSKREER